MDITSEPTKKPLPFVISLPNDGNKYHEILKSTKSVRMQSGFINLQAGQNVGSHTTGNYEELLVILDGFGEIELDGHERQKIQKNCVAYIPPATEHNVFNLGNTPLRYIYIVSRVE